MSSFFTDPLFATTLLTKLLQEENNKKFKEFELNPASQSSLDQIDAKPSKTIQSTQSRPVARNSSTEPKLQQVENFLAADVDKFVRDNGEAPDEQDCEDGEEVLEPPAKKGKKTLKGK